MLVLNVLLNLVLVPAYGALGAVLALLICEVCAVSMDLWFLHNTGIKPSLAVTMVWAGLLTGSIALGAVAQFLPPVAAMTLYWALGGSLGLFLLIKAKVSQL